MAFRGGNLLDSECGQLNPMLKVASHFTQDTTLRETLGAPGSSRSIQNESFTPGRQELLPPTTFQMDSLLREIQSMDNAGPVVRAPVPGPSIADLARASEWASDYGGTANVGKNYGAVWAGEYFDAELDNVWNQAREPMVPFQRMQSMTPGPQGMLPRDLLNDSNVSMTAKELLDDAKWVDDFVETAEKTELMSAAGDLLNTVHDPNMKATEFMKFVEKISTGEVDFDATAAGAAGPETADTTSEDWASEYDRNVASGQSWAEEFALQSNVNDMPRGLDEEGKEDFWHKLQEEWDRLAQENTSSHPWLTETAQLDQPYEFKEDNPFQTVEDPLSEGKRKLLDGDIPSAVLLFEVAVNQSPENPECWLLLGTTQALNEQDPLAISALNKCLSMDPTNLNALMSLAASLTNESHHLQAANALKRWLKNNPKYSAIIPEEVQPLDTRTSTMLPPEELERVQRYFMQAARINPTSAIDPDVQSGLGILFNLGGDFEKAADCFQAALTVNPEDPLLWNRLGATLANGGKSAEAIGAYRKSLEISPGCVRTRYNLGISCVNLGAYREAAEHFVSSLNIQAAGRTGDQDFSQNSPSATVMSDSIWSSLRMVLHLQNRTDLAPAITAKDLSRLNQEFQVPV